MTRAVELDIKRALERFLLNPNSEVKSAQNSAKSATATSCHAQSTVFSVIGLNGLFVMKSVEVESKLVPERSTHHHSGVEKYVKLHANKRFATPNHAQSTALWDYGQDGLTVPNHAEVVLPVEPEMSSSPLSTEEMLALTVKKPANAMFNPAQLTALWTSGQNGQLAQKLVVEESPLELEMLSPPQPTEERNVDSLEMSTSVMLTSAQSIAYFLIGLNGANVIRHAVVENPKDLER